MRILILPRRKKNSDSSRRRAPTVSESFTRTPHISGKRHVAASRRKTGGVR